MLSDRIKIVQTRQYYVYILSNFTRTVLYTGVTNNLVKRIHQHKNDLVKGFTQRYQIHDLVYYEIFNDPESAIEREKQVKNYSRKKKEGIIQKFNPELKDLYEEIIK